MQNSDMLPTLVTCKEFLKCTMNQVFANGPKDSKNGTWSHLAKHYKVRIKGKVEESKERSSALPYTSV